MACTRKVPHRSGRASWSCKWSDYLHPVPGGQSFIIGAVQSISKRKQQMKNDPIGCSSKSQLQHFIAVKRRWGKSMDSVRVHHQFRFFCFGSFLPARFPSIGSYTHPHTLIRWKSQLVFDSSSGQEQLLWTSCFMDDRLHDDLMNSRREQLYQYRASPSPPVDPSSLSLSALLLITDDYSAEHQIRQNSQSFPPLHTWKAN